MSSILEHPEAQALLADATLSPGLVAGCRNRLTRFLQRYPPLFYREEQRELATLVIAGKLSDLQRKTSEPIANQAHRPRKPVQHFVGCGLWDDEAVLAELRHHVRDTLADPTAVLVVDPSTFPKKGTQSCGVQRQWCGRLGKKDNCQAGVFLVYAARGGRPSLRSGGSTSGRRCSRRRRGSGSRCVRGRRARWSSRPRKRRGRRPRTRKAASGRWSGWWSCAAWRKSPRPGTR